ncbi:hypothetical protein [Burkholderia sp. Ac-20353]|uniref:hypothetical protein n=1 Tax=Burkholderia sp. Ac-20353 TaxID=2703894 RepID=UPI00197B3D14|nr:hypothetical protein [Burkholderia sp. Ac-20353]MBN3788283.1 hypothetical protein [Burkholderia sp. Ac-20353]
MVRFLYAGYLALALYILYPMVQTFLAADATCVRSAAMIDAAGPDGHPASGAQQSQRDCALLMSRTNAAAGQAGGLH